MAGLGCFPFARRYLGNRSYFLFLGVLRCFSSPRWLDQAMYSPEHVTVFTMTGFPIQKSPDQSLLSNSPKLIAAFHVFHRLPAPRHPPFALYSLATIKPQIKFKRFNANIQIQRHKNFGLRKKITKASIPVCYTIQHHENPLSRTCLNATILMGHVVSF